MIKGTIKNHEGTKCIRFEQSADNCVIANFYNGDEREEVRVFRRGINDLFSWLKLFRPEFVKGRYNEESGS